MDDVAEATVRCLNFSGYNVLNIGNDRPVGLMEMIKIIENLMGKEANINYMPRHPADNLITWADLTKTQELLNWRPQVSLEDGLERVINWYSENRDWAKNIKIEK